MMAYYMPHFGGGTDLIMNRMVAVLCSVVLLCSCMQQDTSLRESMQEPDGISRDALLYDADLFPEEEHAQPEKERYGRSFLTPEEARIYDEAAQVLERMEFPAQVMLPAAVDDHAAARIITYLYYDNPLFYWAELTTGLADGGRGLLIQAKNGLSEEQLLEQEQDIAFAADALLSGISGEDYEIVTQIHDKMIRTIARNNGMDAPNAGNIYGALVEKSAMCDGYSKTFQLLADQMGISCVYYAGRSTSGSAHSWNAVMLQGSWYYVDVTWDTLNPGLVLHTHLGITLEEVLRERVFDEDQYPEIQPATATTHNFFTYRGYSVAPETDEDIITELAEVFVNSLADNELPERYVQVFLEAKIAADPQRYAAYKRVFIQDVFAVLRQMQRIADERGLGVEIKTQGSISCNHKDVMQILVLFPEVRSTGQNDIMGGKMQ